MGVIKTFYFPDAEAEIVFRHLKFLSENDKKTVNEVVRAALREYVDRRIRTVQTKVEAFTPPALEELDEHEEEMRRASDLHRREAADRHRNMVYVDVGKGYREWIPGMDIGLDTGNGSQPNPKRRLEEK